MMPQSKKSRISCVAKNHVAEEILYSGACAEAGLGIVADSLVSSLRRGDCVGLAGPLGAGKTRLVREIVTRLGLDDLSCFSSPTFSVMNYYEATSSPVIHIDFYRLGSKEELDHLDLNSELGRSDAIKFVEWADKFGALPHGFTHLVEIAPIPDCDEERFYRVIKMS